MAVKCPNCPMDVPMGERNAPLARWDMFEVASFNLVSQRLIIVHWGGEGGVGVCSVDSKGLK